MTVTAKVLEKKFKNLESQLREEAKKQGTPDAENYVNNIVKMMNRTMKTFKAMGDQNQMQVSESEFSSMLDNIAKGAPQSQNREQRRQTKTRIPKQPSYSGPKINIK